MQDTNIPVIAIDGGAGTGKGTVRAILAKELGFHELDSGVLYRAVALSALRLGSSKRNEPEEWVRIAKGLQLRVSGEQIFLNGENVTREIRDDRVVGKAASLVSQNEEVRSALFRLQIEMRRLPGLVADGRDQGDIFDTPHRFFLEASAEIRAERKLAQSEEKGDKANYEEILEEILRRDKADSERSVQPLRPHPEAHIICTDNISAREVAEKILGKYRG